MTDIRERILYEDNHLIIVNKEAGELVQGDITGDVPLLEKVREYLREEYKKPGNVFTGLIHRIDRPTSGAVVFAKTSKALARMNALFEKREVDKVYRALVKVKPAAESGRLQHFLKKNQKQNRSYVVPVSDTNGKKAVLNYRLIKSSHSFHLLEIELETGRHHQIRAQLAAIGSPIKGDLKYGFPRSNQDASISLHAYSLSFKHPVGGRYIEIKAPFPYGDKAWHYFL